jgi:hypothetical protein
MIYRDEQGEPHSVIDLEAVLAKIEGHLSRIATALEIIASSSGLHQSDSDNYLRERPDSEFVKSISDLQIMVGDMARVHKSHDIWEKDTVVRITRVSDSEVWACAEVSGTYYEDVINPMYLEKVNGQEK